MSCRVLGYDIERAVMHRLVESIRLDRERRVYGTIVETPANIPCRDLFQKCGFVRVGGQWVLETGISPDLPKHVSFRLDDSAGA
jgi:predicted enzyme involved in methoxymalonyl-ACP biosynthesis